MSCNLNIGISCISFQKIWKIRSHFHPMMYVSFASRFERSNHTFFGSQLSEVLFTMTRVKGIYPYLTRCHHWGVMLNLLVQLGTNGLNWTYFENFERSHKFWSLHNVCKLLNGIKLTQRELNTKLLPAEAKLE